MPPSVCLHPQISAVLPCFRGMHEFVSLQSVLTGLEAPGWWAGSILLNACTFGCRRGKVAAMTLQQGERSMHLAHTVALLLDARAVRL